MEYFETYRKVTRTAPGGHKIEEIEEKTIMRGQGPRRRLEELTSCLAGWWVILLKWCPLKWCPLKWWIILLVWHGPFLEMENSINAEHDLPLPGCCIGKLLESSISYCIATPY